MTSSRRSWPQERLLLKLSYVIVHRDKCQAFTEDWRFSFRELKVCGDGDNNLFVLHIFGCLGGISAGWELIAKKLEFAVLVLIVQPVDSQQLWSCRITDWKYTLAGRKCLFDGPSSFESWFASNVGSMSLYSKGAFL